VSERQGRVAAAVLAAGRSSRMGRPKALLPLGGVTFLERVVATADGAGLSPVRVVIGAHREAIELALPWLHDRFVHNDRVEDGQLHSLRLVLRDLPASCEGCVVMLVDHPLVREGTVRALVQAFLEHRAPMVVPRFGARRGHPALFGRELFDPLCHGSLEGGARRVVRERGVRPLEVPVDDPGVLADVDTPGEYEEARGAALS
jgi:molybdenum cofactor cytidylyltransferase